MTAPSGRLAFSVGEGDVGARLDRFLGLAAAARRLALSRTRLKGLIEAGYVTVDGQVVRAAATKLIAEGAQSKSRRRRRTNRGWSLKKLPLDIVFEDPHLLVLDKPAGLVVHPAAGHEDGTLVNALIAHCGDSLSGIGGVRRPGIVHRLDKDTSGLLVVAKTDAAHQGLSALFADHGRTGSLVREYRALVWGTPPMRQGTVDAPLGRHPRQREKMAVVSPEQGRHAVTHWRLEQRIRPRQPCLVPSGDRTHAPDTRSSHAYWPSDSGRFRLRRGIQEQGGAIVANRGDARWSSLVARHCTPPNWDLFIRSPGRNCCFEQPAAQGFCKSYQ